MDAMAVEARVVVHKQIPKAGEAVELLGRPPTDDGRLRQDWDDIAVRRGATQAKGGYAVRTDIEHRLDRELKKTLGRAMIPRV